MLRFLNVFARNSDPITSDRAAETVPVEDLERTVLSCLKFWPTGLTCRELANSTGVELGSVTPRMKPLEQKGLIYRDGIRRVCGCRTAATVWKAVPVQGTLL